MSHGNTSSGRRSYAAPTVNYGGCKSAPRVCPPVALLHERPPVYPDHAFGGGDTCCTPSCPAQRAALSVYARRSVDFNALREARDDGVQMHSYQWPRHLWHKPPVLMLQRPSAADNAANDGGNNKKK